MCAVELLYCQICKISRTQEIIAATSNLLTLPPNVLWDAGGWCRWMATGQKAASFKFFSRFFRMNFKLRDSIESPRFGRPAKSFELKEAAGLMTYCR